LNACPEVYHAVVRSWVSAEPRITVYLNTRVSNVSSDGDRIARLCAIGPQGVLRFRPRGVVDATGTAALVRLIDPALVLDEADRAAGGFIFQLRGVAAGALAFPTGLAVVRAIHAAAAAGTLPPNCGKAGIDAGVHDDEAYVKLFVPLANGGAAETSRDEAFRAQAAVVAFLADWPGFGAAGVARTGAIGVRDGGRIDGEYRLTGADVRRGARFADAACRCGWPIEYWDPEEGLILEYLADDSHYEIPLRALTVRGRRNVWAAGKCLSADRHAHASARVVGTCWAMGEAVGLAAAAL